MASAKVLSGPTGAVRACVRTLGLFAFLFAVGAAPAAAQTFTTIADGNWTNPATWSGGSVPATSGDFLITFTINIHHTVEWNTGNNIKNLGTIRIEPLVGTTARLNVPTGINIDNEGGDFIIINGALIQFRFVGGGNTGTAQSGTFKNIGGVVEVLNSVVEIAQDWTNESGGTRTFENSCLLTGQDFSNSDSSDTLIGASVSLGWHGSGSFQYANDDFEFQDVRIQLAGTSGNFELNNGTAFGDIDYITLKNHVSGNVGSGEIVASSSLDTSAGLNLDAFCADTYTPNGKFSGTQTSEARPACPLTSTFFPCVVAQPQEPTLTLVKAVTNDNGGTAVASNWTLTATGPGPTTITGASGSGAVTDQAVPAGDYTLMESGPSGYTAGAWNCDDGTLNGNVLTLVNGDDATCTITNNDQPANLTLTKIVNNVNGGNAVVADWTLSANAINFTSGVQQQVNAAVYTLSESGPSGYTASAWQCTGGSFVLPDQLTLANGQTASCSITNTDVAPGLTLIKNVTNDDGGSAVAADFTLTLQGTDGVHNTAQNYSTGATPTVVANVSYTLDELSLNGYTKTGVACVDTGNGNAPVSHPVSLAEGQQVTCTLTNDDDGALLALVKSVTNDDGGSAVANDWTLIANGPTPQQGAGGFSSTQVSAGQYTLSESGGPTGYTAGAWNCDDGTLNGNVLTLVNGDDATCTITNNDQPANLTLTKIVNNVNGGNAVVADWTLSANAINFTSGVQQQVNAAVYTLSESGPSGYIAGDWQCSGGSFVSPDQLTLANGQTASCSITNTDVASGLTLIKNVTNDNGGNDSSGSFDLTLTGNDGTHNAGVDYNTGATPAVDSNVSYTVSETPNPGYTLTGITCLDDGSAANVGTTFSLSEGQSVTCTFVNDDQAPALMLIKNVTNDDGGSAVAADFTLTLQGTDGVHNTAQNYSTGATPTVVANVSYTLDELSLNGYTKTGVACVDTGNGNAPVSHPVSLAEGQQVTCTLTNDDVAPGSLTVIKSVNNDEGGAAVAGDFTLHVTGNDGQGGNCGEDGATDFASGDSIASPQDGCTYTISEDALAGYTQTGVSCVDAANGNANLGHPVTFQTDQSVVCTITNDDIAETEGPDINLSKSVTSVSPVDADTFEVVYSVQAENAGSTLGSYDLVDTFDPGTGITLVSAELTSYVAGTENSQTGTLAGALPHAFTSGATLVTNEALAAGLVESWRITAVFDVDFDDPGLEAVCSAVGFGAGTGFHNFVEGNIDEVLDDNHACGGPPLDDRARFRVVKDFTDDNPLGVEVRIDCNTGLSLHQSKVITEGEINAVTFIVTSFDAGELDCEISETVPDGYAPSYAAAAGEGGSAGSISNIDGCLFEDVVAGLFTCLVTNTPESVDVVINKNWVIEGANLNGVDTAYRIELWCDAEIVSISQASLGGITSNNGEWHAFWEVDGVDDETFTAQVVPNEFGESECTVEETVFDNAIEVSSSCKVGNEPVPLPIMAGQAPPSCTITNTVFFEGIPVLNRYGLALLALLMLGVGFVGFRRFV